MTNERAKELQENIAKEALALLMVDGEMDTACYERCIELIGTAGKVPYKDTEHCLDLIVREREAIRNRGENDPVIHVPPESELPMRASGLQTLDNVWGLFEAAVSLGSESARAQLFSMAKTLEETQNLLDWVEKTEEEKLECMPPEGEHTFA